jgi:hypothetical protein
MTTPSRFSFLQCPGTRLGWWGFGLAVVFVLMFLIISAVFMPASQVASNDWWMRTYLPFYGIFMLACGMSAGVVSLIAMINKPERSRLVWFAILP